MIANLYNLSHMIAKKTSLPYDRFVLPNGLVTLVYPMPGVLTSIAEIDIRNGSAYENEGQEGISHFIEHMAFQGTKTYPDALSLSQKVESLGGTFNAISFPFLTEYWIKLPHTNMVEGLGVLYELVFEPSISEEEIEREKQVVLSEYFDFWRDPDNRYGHELKQKRFREKGHPYARQGLGNPKIIRRFKKEDIMQWRQKYYNPQNMVLSIAGNVDRRKIKQAVKRKFGKAPAGKLYKTPKVDPKGYSNFLIYHKNDRKKQIRFSLSFPTFGNQLVSRKTRLSAGVLSRILGGSSASRLFARLREKERLVYTVSSVFVTFPYMGILYISGSTGAENLSAVMTAIRQELDLLLKNGISEAEFKRASAVLDANTLMQFDNPNTISTYFADEELRGLAIWTPEDYVKQAAKLKKGDADEIAKKVFDFSKVNIGLQGNVAKKDIEKIKKLFKP